MKALYSLLALTLFVFSTCTKKDLDLEVFEKDCKNFKINNVSYVRNSSPCDPVGSASGEFTVSFDIDGESKCVNRIVTHPVFYDNKNNVLGSTPAYKDTFYLNEPDMVFNGKTVTFTFKYTFTSSAAAQPLNFINLRFETQNEIGNPSNSQEVRLNTNCLAPDASTYNAPTTTVIVPNKKVSIRFWDNASEDGDIISVYLNGTWVLENFMIRNAGDTFDFTINSGVNTLIIYAVNQGKSGPNTLSVQVNSGTMTGNEIQMEPNLLTGESVNIKF